MKIIKKLNGTMERIFYKKECKKGMERKKVKSEYGFVGVRDNSLEYRCEECREINLLNKLNDSINLLINKFPSIYKFCNGDLNKFVLLVRKGVYPYEYMDSWEKFDETSIPPKEAFYRELNLENITDKDYEQVKKIWKVFRKKNRGKYHDLYVQCDT